MPKGIKKLSIFIILLCIVFIQIASVSGKETNENTTISNGTIDVINPQSNSPDIEFQTSYISDSLEAGKTYQYKVQVRNVGNKDITIEPRFNANSPILYAMAATGQASDASITNATQESNITTETNSIPTPSTTPVTSSAMMSTNTNEQAFDNSAVNISAPSTIKVGEVVDMIITVTVPDNVTGSYYTNIDMNVNGVENDQYNPQLSLSFAVQQPHASPYVKTFSTTTDAPVMIDVSADTYNSDMGTRISPKIEDPSFCVKLTYNGNPVNLTLVKTIESGNVGTGNIYPTWVSTTENSYQSYGVHYAETYKVQGAVGDYKLCIFPKNTNNFGYSITIGNNT